MQENEENQPIPETIDAYIAAFPPEVREELTKFRRLIREAAPGAQEKIAYRMPAYTLHGTLVYFAAFKKHIGFYPSGSAIVAFKDDLSPYKSSKGAVQFPLGQPLPYDLLRRIVAYRAAENSEKAGRKPKSGSKPAKP